MVPVPNSLFNYKMLKVGQLLCKNCLHKLVQMKNEDNLKIEEPSSPESQSSQDSSSSSNIDFAQDVSQERLNLVLPLLKISPIKKSKKYFCYYFIYIKAS